MKSSRSVAKHILQPCFASGETLRLARSQLPHIRTAVDEQRILVLTRQFPCGVKFLRCLKPGARLDCIFRFADQLLQSPLLNLARRLLRDENFCIQARVPDQSDQSDQSDSSLPGKACYV